jgi:protein gp37
MAKDSKIEWTNHTFNPWWGCVRVSPACRNCYAEAIAHRFGISVWGKRSERRMLSDAYWSEPYKWNKSAEVAGVRPRVFCASMADVFEDRTELDPLRLRLWELIDRTKSLDWLLLTKRPHLVRQMVPWGALWPENVWLGTTAETQLWAERRVPQLLNYPARVRFVSCEPLLGAIDLSPWMYEPSGRKGIDWVIAGGESGHHSRPSNPEWFRSLRDQCTEAGVAFHFKQWGNWHPASLDSANRHRCRNLQRADGSYVVLMNVGKKAAGRKLDDSEWNGMPNAA